MNRTEKRDDMTQWYSIENTSNLIMVIIISTELYHTKRTHIRTYSIVTQLHS